ncbi:SSS family transporter [Anseongella ginsenosidimutans]|uniref:SSS family transporter n=1 Tax=Anseongella ginsenosidimutans TaxID=496056 RepID=A0A4R3KN85_9SPHI|nr:sodium/solute symporter [Anseongella ginsenosidimutans]QEC52360.1 sodium/solute symporter [Anseongella ginsenosidimutans]TCS85897.1 SSS family transporter [Anseongella ginsenosidimutans]
MVRILSVPFVACIIALTFFSNHVNAQEQGPVTEHPATVTWSELPPIPSVSAAGENTGEGEGEGLAGHFAGVHKDVMLVAGGTFFPEKGRPWNGASRVWNGSIHVLERKNSGEYQWLDTVFKLPSARAYGASVSTPEGVLCIGGMDASGNLADVFLLSWDESGRTVQTTAFPDLPAPMAFMGAVLLDGYVYIAGGTAGQDKGHTTKSFYRLNLQGGKQSSGDDWHWEKLPSWNGPGRMMPVLAEQNNGKYHSLFLFSGRKGAAEGEELLYDAHVFDVHTKEWKQLQEVRLGDGSVRCLSGASSVSVGLNHILVFSGADSEDHREFRAAQNQYRNLKTSAAQDSMRGVLNEITDKHSGFSSEVLVYHTLTDTWIKVGDFPRAAPVATQAFWWKEEIIIPGGEIAPALRSPAVWKASLGAKESSILNAWDYLLILLYFITVLYIGYRYKKNIKTTDDYYKAGGRIPGWASGMAMFGTLLSAITFLTTPAKTFNESWIYFLPTISSLVVAPIVVFYIIPAYFKITVTTAYEYLENRFNATARILGSLSFLAFQVAKFGVMLLLPALAISAITGIDVMVCIIVIGLFSTIYGTVGGIEAVVWTEVLQVVVFLLAAALSILVVAMKLDGGVSEIIATNSDFGKFDFVNWDFSFAEITIFVAISYWVGGGMVPYIADQTVIQKYLVTKDAKSASRGVWVNGILIVVSSVLFFAIGSALFAYYAAYPEKLNPALPTQESIYPWFIVNELPSGIRGIVVAGIFAVAMSTISSTMNSMSATVVTDFVRFKPTEHKKLLVIAKVVSALFGILGTLLAAIMFIYEVGSLWDMIRRLTGLLTGGLAGLFLLGIFTKRANHIGALAGFTGSAVIQYLVSMHTPMHFMTYSFTGMLSCFVIGYLASIVAPVQAKKVVEKSNE